MKKLSSGHKVHHEVYSVLALKYEVHRHQERVIYLEHYEPLEVDALHGSAIKYYVLAHRLESVELSLCVWKVHQVDLCESTLAQDRDCFKLL